MPQWIIMCMCQDWQTCEHPWPALMPLLPRVASPDVLEQIRVLVDLAEHYEDAGPPREGWQSDALMHALTSVREWLNGDVMRESWSVK